MQKLAILFIFYLFLMASCKDVKSEKSPETNTETSNWQLWPISAR